MCKLDFIKKFKILTEGPAFVVESEKQPTAAGLWSPIVHSV